VIRRSSESSRVAPAGIVLREARAADRQALADSGWRAFRGPDPEMWQRYFATETEYLSPRDTLIAEIDGRIAGHATELRLAFGVRGHDLPMRGVAAVAVVPESRRRGVAEALVRGLLRRMKRRGDALSMLYPFRVSFYRRFGWGTVEWIEALRVLPSQLPPSRERRHVRRLDREQDGRALRRVYDAARRRLAGPLARSETWWTQRVLARAAEGVVHVDPGSGRIEGYALYDTVAEPPNPRPHVVVRELFAVTPAAFRGLLGFFEALGDQYLSVQLMRPRGEGTPLLEEFGLVGSSESLRMMELSGLSAAGAMLRLVDVPAALALHPGPAANGARGRVGLDIDDPVFPAARAFDVSFGAAGARARAGRDARDRLALPVSSLAQIYLGAASARTLLAHGFAAGSERAAARLDEAFAGPPPFLGALNAF
jgi:predicted acetyltransferase